MEIRIIKFSQPERMVEVSTGTTVEEALRMADISFIGQSIIVNGFDSHISACLRKPSVIHLIPMVNDIPEEAWFNQPSLSARKNANQLFSNNIISTAEYCRLLLMIMLTGQYDLVEIADTFKARQ